MPLVVKCDYCNHEVTNGYYEIMPYENDSIQVSETKYMCYACALISRKLRFA